MKKGTGKFLGRGSVVLGVGGKDLENYVLASGQLIKSNNLPDSGVYEIQKILLRCDYDDCGRQLIRVRRVDMRYLNNKQKQNVTDISPRFRGVVLAS